MPRFAPVVVAGTLLDEERLWAEAKYVECNPVRAGLVERAEDYRWSSARAHALAAKFFTPKHSTWVKALAGAAMGGQHERVGFVQTRWQGRLRHRGGEKPRL